MKTRTKSKLLAVLTALTIATPALADASFDSLMAERKSLVQLVFQGRADASTVARIEVLTAQIQSKINEKTEKQQAQQASIVENMDRVDSQMQSVSNILFGGATVTVPGSSQAPASPLGAGKVLASYGPPLGDEIEKLVRIAVQKTPTAANAAQDKYSRPLQKFIAMTKESINFTIPYRGYGPSAEAANTILGGQNLKSLSAAEYAQQKFMDETHLAVTIQTLQLAQALGTSDITRAEAAYKELADLADDDSASRVKALLDSQLNSSVKPVKLDIMGRQTEYLTILKKILDGDAVIQDIQTKLKKYTSHGKAASITQQVVPALLGIASCVPNFVGPCARMLLGTFLVATGGPDSKRLMDELYLAEKLQSRTSILSQEIQLELSALDRDESGVLNWAAKSLLEQ